MNVIFVVVGIVLLAVVAMSLVASRRRKKPKRPPAHVISVSVTGEHLVVVDSRTRSSTTVPWSTVRRITVITTKAGPFVDDLFYHVIHDGGEITLPSEANHMIAFVEHIQTLPGFDRVAFTSAIGSTRNETFVVCLRND